MSKGHLPCLGAAGAMWDRPHVRQSQEALTVLVVLPFWALPIVFLPLLIAATLVGFPDLWVTTLPDGYVLDPCVGFRWTVGAWVGVFPNQALVPSNCLEILDSSCRSLFQNWFRVIVSLSGHSSIALLI